MKIEILEPLFLTPDEIISYPIVVIVLFLLLSLMFVRN